MRATERESQRLADPHATAIATQPHEWRGWIRQGEEIRRAGEGSRDRTQAGYGGFTRHPTNLLLCTDQGLSA
ncbi:hypothetical protein GCM10009805_15330 [Leucobacter chromiireducens subsp. solipictus]